MEQLNGFISESLTPTNNHKLVIICLKKSSTSARRLAQAKEMVSYTTSSFRVFLTLVAIFYVCDIFSAST